jgi:hypothetical protein
MALATNCDSFTLVSVLQSYASNCIVADRVAIAAAFPKCNDCEYDTCAANGTSMNIHAQGHVETGARLATPATSACEGILATSNFGRQLKQTRQETRNAIVEPPLSEISALQ